MEIRGDLRLAHSAFVVHPRDRHYEPQVVVAMRQALTRPPGHESPFLIVASPTILIAFSCRRSYPPPRADGNAIGNTTRLNGYSEPYSANGRARCRQRHRRVSSFGTRRGRPSGTGHDLSTSSRAADAIPSALMPK